MIQWSVAKSPRVAEQCDVNIKSINQDDTSNREKDCEFAIWVPWSVMVSLPGEKCSVMSVCADKGTFPKIGRSNRQEKMLKRPQMKTCI
ncbi:hypothetical protein TNCV_5041661 [Trichonephila clavipes]|nr:hypothetical protein TNCV_5041661 [Trichonephila clavipes]